MRDRMLLCTMNNWVVENLVVLERRLVREQTLLVSGASIQKLLGKIGGKLHSGCLLLTIQVLLRQLARLHWLLILPVDLCVVLGGRLDLG